MPAVAVRSASLAPKLECLNKVIYSSDLNASFRPLSGKPTGKHGLNMSGLVGDEIHEWKNGDLYTFVHDSAASRRQPLEFLISTAGQKGSHGEEVFKECQAIKAGDIEDPETLVVIYAPQEDDDWTLEATWRKANPNFGKSVKIDPFLADFKRARQLPRLENDFKRYSIGSTTDGLKTDPDGSITILIQNERPKDTSNWLPASKEPFNLTMRLYGAQTPILNGSYRLPPVKRVQ